MTEKLRGRYMFVSANVVVHGMLSHVHAHLGVLLPFQPPPPGSQPGAAWVLPEQAAALDGTPANKSQCAPDPGMLATLQVNSDLQKLRDGRNKHVYNEGPIADAEHLFLGTSWGVPPLTRLCVAEAACFA